MDLNTIFVVEIFALWRYVQGRNYNPQRRTLRRNTVLVLMNSQTELAHDRSFASRRDSACPAYVRDANIHYSVTYARICEWYVIYALFHTYVLMQKVYQRFPTTTHLHPVTNEQRRVRHGARPKQASSTEFEKFPLLDPYYPIRLITFPVNEFQVNPRRPKEQSAVSNTAWDQKYEETP